MGYNTRYQQVNIEIHFFHTSSTAHLIFNHIYTHLQVESAAFGGPPVGGVAFAAVAADSVDSSEFSSAIVPKRPKLELRNFFPENWLFSLDNLENNFSQR